MHPPTILFDGVCNLCAWSVQFIIRRDPQAQFRFAALQSPAGQRLLAAHRQGVGRGQTQTSADEEHTVRAHPRLSASNDSQGAQLLDSVVLLERGRAYTRSTAALRIARRLRWPWPILWPLVAFPRPLRDWAYDLVARNRYRWFGRRSACMLPTPALRARFLDGG